VIEGQNVELSGWESQVGQGKSEFCNDFSKRENAPAFPVHLNAIVR